MPTTQCPKCSTTCDENAVECPRCGAALQPVGIRRPAAAGPDLSRATPPNSPGGLIRIAATGDAIQVTGRTQTLLGREAHIEQIRSALQTFSDVSKTHASVAFYDREVEVQDLKSTNGTYIDGTLMGSGGTQRVELPVILQLGSSCYVRLDRLPAAGRER